MSASLPSAVHGLYKRTLSPLIHSITGTAGACRFQPTCSEYAVLAVETHGWLRGGWYALWRVLRCNPLGSGGFDPVPGTWPLPDERAAQDTESSTVSPRQLP